MLHHGVVLGVTPSWRRKAVADGRRTDGRPGIQYDRLTDTAAPATTTSNSVGYRTLPASSRLLHYKSRSAPPAPTHPSQTSHSHRPPLCISIGDNVACETDDMERTASRRPPAEGDRTGPGARHDDVCGPDASCTVTLLTPTPRAE